MSERVVVGRRNAGLAAALALLGAHVPSIPVLLPEAPPRKRTPEEIYNALQAEDRARLDAARARRDRRNTKRLKEGR